MFVILVCNYCEEEMVFACVIFLPDVHLLIKIDVYPLDKWGLIEEAIRTIKATTPKEITIYPNFDTVIERAQVLHP